MVLLSITSPLTGDRSSTTLISSLLRMAALLRSALQILSLAVEADESLLFDEAARLYDRGSVLLEQYLHCAFLNSHYHSFCHFPTVLTGSC